MEKKKVDKVVVLLSLAIVVVLIALAYRDLINKTKTYEYYTFSNERGISKYCTNKTDLKCKINGVMVEIKQYSEN